MVASTRCLQGSIAPWLRIGEATEKGVMASYDSGVRCRCSKRFGWMVLRMRLPLHSQMAWLVSIGSTKQSGCSFRTFFLSSLKVVLFRYFAKALAIVKQASGLATSPAVRGHPRSGACSVANKHACEAAVNCNSACRRAQWCSQLLWTTSS
jgi:hypothetical protein